MKRGIWPARHRTASLFALVCTNVAHRHAAELARLANFSASAAGSFAARHYTSMLAGERNDRGLDVAALAGAVAPAAIWSLATPDGKMIFVNAPGRKPGALRPAGLMPDNLRHPGRRRCVAAALRPHDA